MEGIENIALGIVGLIGILIFGFLVCCAQWAVFLGVGKVAGRVLFGARWPKTADGKADWREVERRWEMHQRTMREFSRSGINDDPVDGAQDPRDGGW